MFDQDYLRETYHQQSQQVADRRALKDAPAMMKLFGGITVILVAAWAIDKILVTVQDWYSAILG